MATTSKACYYATLGDLPKDATPEAITAAYKKIARAHHPDRTLHKPEDERARAAETFKAAAEAHEVLSDPAKRKLYDMYGHAGVGAGAASAADDAAAQEMFEAMFSAGHKAKRARGPLGGAMFVDPERGHFFQRRFRPDELDAMRREMEDGLPVVEACASLDNADSVASRTRLPVGPWEVRLVEADEAHATITVTLCAADKAKDDEEVDEEWKALKASLRLERTFALPAHADLDAADVAIDEHGVLSVTAPKKGGAAAATTPPAVAASRPNSPTSDSTVASPTVAGSRTPSPIGVEELHVPEEATAAQRATAAEFATGAAPGAKVARNDVRRRKKQASSLRSGFFNDDKPRARVSSAAPKAAAEQGPRPMEVDEGCKENADAARNAAIDEAMRAQVREMMQGA